jgi:methylenetetrahydrofolate reductase (NADPH)
VPRNPLRESLQAGRFCHMVELVASAISREARLLEIASHLAVTPGVVAGSITSYAGGSAGQDPVRVGTAARARGLTPNIHVTCVSKDRRQLREMVQTISSLGLENVFALTGDYPKGATPMFDMDSVELVTLMNELREKEGLPLWIGVAVSPFKYTEPDCAYQYLKLEKKFAAGANYAITQLGFDSRKFAELKRYLDERGIQKPVFGNVYVLGLKPAEKMSKGEPPGCWVAPELVEKIREEVKAKDKGEAARLERAARMVAILRGMGYAGAYIGGTHKTEHIRWIIERGKELAPKWEEIAKELTYPPASAFYMYGGSTSPAPRKVGFLETLFKSFCRNFLSPTNVREGGLIDRLAKAVSRWIDKRPSIAHSLERAEFAFKSPSFGCQSCGNCVLPNMEYVCPQTCPKQLRNGPCGGTFMGQCEVIPERACIWVKVYERAKAADEVESLKVYIPPPDRALKDTSAWVNYFLNKDSRPGHAKAGTPGPLFAPKPLPEPPPAKKEEPKEKKEKVAVHQ